MDRTPEPCVQWVSRTLEEDYFAAGPNTPTSVVSDHFRKRKSSGWSFFSRFSVMHSCLRMSVRVTRATNHGPANRMTNTVLHHGCCSCNDLKFDLRR